MWYECPVCGYGDLRRKPGVEFGESSHEICPSCGFQFGYTDMDLRISYEEHRKQWIREGMPWRGVKTKPEKWNPVEQLKSAGLLT